MTIFDDFLNAEWKSEYDKKDYRRLFDTMFSILGDKCAKCKFSDRRALQIDHINSNGKSDRLRFKNVLKTMMRYYVSHPDEARAKLQILCANCNQIKKIENNEIPYGSSSLFG